MSSHELVKVTILGTPYTLEGEISRVQAVAHLVDQKMREIKEKSPMATPMQVAILASLELADDLMALQQERSQCLEKIDKLISTINSSKA